MDRQRLEQHLTETYGIPGEFPWAKYPSYRVYRHAENEKWFAVIMDIPKNKVGLSGDGQISVVNLKCDPLLIGSLLEEPGIFPGWHMNKAHWISAALDGSVDFEKLKFLIDISYTLTHK